MQAMAELADRYSFGEIRVTHAQNLVLAHVRQADLHALWWSLAACGLATANVGLAGDIIACPGLDYCNLANTRSIPLAQRISEGLAPGQHEIGDLGIKISGCGNACGHHHVGHIGLLDVDKNGAEFYQITLGGSANQDAALGRIIGPAVSSDQVVNAVETLTDTYLARRLGPEETFIEAYRRIGSQPFKKISIILIKDGRITADQWLSIPDAVALPLWGPVIVSLAGGAP